MSATKRDSPDGSGGYDPDYEAWSDSLPQITDEDLIAMAADDYEHRRACENNQQSQSA